MPHFKHIVIVAGEESGDAHAAHLVHELTNIHEDLKFSGIGGQHMENAGVELISDLARHGVTGFTEVIRHIQVIRKAFSNIKAHLEKNKPDLLILVDYPGFNLRLARFAKKKLRLKVLYYISPQIWAWKAGRIHTIKASVDFMAVILPFEKAIYQKARVPVAFTGHPLIKKIPIYTDLQSLREELKLPVHKKIVAFLPGSRRNEIEKHMPVLMQTASRFTSDVHFVIPVAPSLSMELMLSYLSDLPNISLISGRALDVAACSDCVVVASGTASLECALLLKPMCIIYKVSFLSYLIAAKVVNVKYLGLCNLLQNKMIVPELLQYDCNPDTLTEMVKELLNNQHTRLKMVEQLTFMKNSLSASMADKTMAETVQDMLFKPQFGVF